jgi:hypothetical protein
MKRCICGQLINDDMEECSECARLPPVRVDSIVRCIWTEDSEGCYGTSCGHAWMFTHELGLMGEQGDGFRFCPFCGMQIETPNAPIDRAAKPIRVK